MKFKSDKYHNYQQKTFQLYLNFIDLSINALVRVFFFYKNKYFIMIKYYIIFFIIYFILFLVILFVTVTKNVCFRQRLYTKILFTLILMCIFFTFQIFRILKVNRGIVSLNFDLLNIPTR